MPFVVPLDKAQAEYPEYIFIEALTPSEQKAAFHVEDQAGNHCCLKIIAPNYDVVRLQREILALQSLAHPNVAKFKEYTCSYKEGHNRHCLVEEYIDGTDLSNKFQKDQEWSKSDASKFFAELCDGLSALEEKNIVHRDLKPSNIRVRSSGSPVIIDFGLIRCLDLPDRTRTVNGAAIGTPPYFAPEQFQGTKYDIDHRTDLFAVGILLYEALFAQHPFNRSGMSYQELSEAVCNSDDHLNVTQFAALPDKWRLIIEKLLEKERSKRPYSALQVASILRKIGEL